MPKSEYEQEMPQSHTTDQPLVLLGRGKEQWQGNENLLIKVKQPALNQLSLLQRHDYKTRKDTKFCKIKREGPYTNHPQAMGLSINK